MEAPVETPEQHSDLNITEVTPLLNINLGGEIKMDLVTALTEKSGGKEKEAKEIVTEAVDLTRTILQEAKRDPKILGDTGKAVIESFGKMTGEEEALVAEAVVLVTLLRQKGLSDFDTSLFWGAKELPAIAIYDANRSKSKDKLNDAYVTQMGAASASYESGLAKVGTTDRRISILETIAHAVAKGPATEDSHHTFEVADYLQTEVLREKIYTGKNATRSYTDNEMCVRNYLHENPEIAQRSTDLKQKIESLLQ